MNTRINRRHFLRCSAYAGSSVLLLAHSRSARTAEANEKINLAIIGVTGRGGWFVQSMPGLGANLVALCDVNRYRAADTFKRFPRARTFADFRKMFDAMAREIDAVVVATPDHTHAVASMAAIRAGKPVYCEKPLTHEVREARALREAAAKFKVATQMGNQGTASEAFRRALEYVRGGVLGEIREVHSWHDGGGTGPRPLPAGSEEVPADLDWDVWLGPAEERAYHPAWMRWHSWRDFATGNLGNWASHSLNLAFRALNVHTLWPWHAEAETPRRPAAPLRIEAKVSAVHGGSFPRWEVITWDIPTRGSMPSVRVTWHNGSQAPGERARIEERLGRKLDWGDAGERKWADFCGCLLVGSKGRMILNAHNVTLALLPEEKFRQFEEPPKTVPRSGGHEREWLGACRGGPAPMSNFNYSGPLAEFLMLGNVATQFEGALEFDPLTCQIKNHAAADRLLLRDYRKGWTLSG